MKMHPFVRFGLYAGGALFLYEAWKKFETQSKDGISVVIGTPKIVGRTGVGDSTPSTANNFVQKFQASFWNKADDSNIPAKFNTEGTVTAGYNGLTYYM